MSYKKCARCGEPLPEGAHPRQKYCDECKAAAYIEMGRRSSRKYAAAHKEQIAAYQRKLYATNEKYKQHVKDKATRWAKAHPERAKELRRQWYERQKNGTV